MGLMQSGVMKGAGLVMIGGAVRDEASPVVKGLTIVLREHGGTLLHLDEDERPPDVIGKGRAPTILSRLADAVLGCASHIQRSSVTKGLKESIEENLGLAFLVPLYVET